MKHFKRRMGAASFIGALMLAGCNVERRTQLQSTDQVEVDLLVVQMPEAQAVPLIPELRDKERAGRATDRIIKLVGDDKATLIAWPVLATKSGQRAVVEQIDEFRYATEFDPPGRSVVTKSLKKPGSASPETQDAEKSSGATSTTETIGSADSGDTPATPVPDTEKGEEVETTTNVTYGVPTAFETRNVGVTFEIEPVISSDRRTIDLNLVPTHVRLLRLRKASISREASKEKTVVDQPEFLTNRVTTSIQVVDGEYTLLGVFKVDDPPGTVELFILHTEIQKMEVPVGQAKTTVSRGGPPPPNGFDGTPYGGSSRGGN